MLTLFRCPLITENKHLLRDPELSSVTRNCQMYSMPLDTLQIGIYKLKCFMNCIKVKRNNQSNSIYSSVSPDLRFKKAPYVNFFTDRTVEFTVFKAQIFISEVYNLYRTNMSAVAVTTDNQKIRRQCPTWPTYFVHTASVSFYNTCTFVLKLFMTIQSKTIYSDGLIFAYRCNVMELQLLVTQVGSVILHFRT